MYISNENAYIANQIDPMADKYRSLSPYHFSFNNPIGFNDPSGADPDYYTPSYLNYQESQMYSYNIRSQYVSWGVSWNRVEFYDWSNFHWGNAKWQFSFGYWGRSICEGRC